MNNWIRKNWLPLAGAAAGILSGFLYWKYVGCLTGTCAITSNPYSSMIYFGIMGAVLFGIFKKQKNTASGN